MPTALISGASIAGPALGYWLAEAGFSVTLVERTPAPRPGGQAIDIRGPAIAVVEKMGLLPAALALRTRHKGMSVVDAEGREQLRTTERTATAGRMGSGDIEIFRDDLSRLLLGAAAGRLTCRYGDNIRHMDMAGSQVSVSFETGDSAAFDIVVGADGMRSNVRRLAFPEDASCVHPLGVGFAVFSTPNLLGLEEWEIAFRDKTSGYALYPSLDQKTLRVNLGFALMPEEFPRGDPAAQRALIRARCAHLKGAVPELLTWLDKTEDLWFGPLAQIKLSNWAQGRAVLVGDAAYCPSPFTGQGTSLALVGAYVLAKELGRSPAAPEAAFARYGAKMRPFVELNQALLDLTREGPVPDAQFDHAKSAIDLSPYG